MALSNRSYSSPTLTVPKGSNLTTLANAVPSQSMHARGARDGKCSRGQMLARNSSLRVYSFTSVSPGLKTGMRCQGKNELPPVPVAAAAAAPSLPPDIVHLDQLACACSGEPLGSATSVQLAADPISQPEWPPGQWCRNGYGPLIPWTCYTSRFVASWPNHTTIGAATRYLFGPCLDPLVSWA